MNTRKGTYKLSCEHEVTYIILPRRGDILWCHTCRGYAELLYVPDKTKCEYCSYKVHRENRDKLEQIMARHMKTIHDEMPKRRERITL